MANQTEVGKLGAEQRFRPAYYALHLLQASTFGKKPALWYAVRIGIAVLFAVVLATVGVHIASPVAVLGFIIYELSRPYWADIFARLGDGETYVALGVSICAIGMMRGLQRKFTSGVCAAVAIGLAIAAGSKENFVLLAVVPLWVLVWRGSTLTAVSKLWLIAAIVYSILIAALVFAGVYNAGHDYYYTPVSLHNTLRVVTQAFRQVLVWVWILGWALLRLLIRFGERKGVLNTVISQTLKKYVAALVILFLVYVAQVVFYSGQDVIDNGGRYLFPQLLARDLAILIGSSVLARLIVETRGRVGFGSAISLVTAVGFVVAASASWDSNRLSAQQRVNESKEFTEKIAVGAAFLRERPASALILNSYSEEDIEPVWSIMEYLRAGGLSNPIVVKINNYSSRSLPSDSNSLRPVLAAQLEDIQAKGRVGRFTPLSAAANTLACYSYGLHGPPAAKCEAGDTIWPPGRSVNQSRYDGDVLSFVEGGNGNSYLVYGWSQAEPWGVWSDGPIATIVLRDEALTGRANAELVVVARGFTTQDQPTQHVRVRVNGVEAGELMLDPKFTSTSLLIPAEALKSSLLQIELIPESPISPAKVGTSVDRRLLGIGLESLQVRELISH